MDILSSEVVQRYRVFAVRRMVVRAAGGHTDEYYVVERPDSVQVVALTLEGRLLMVEQERHGTQARSLEFVAGLIDEGERPEQAAARELEEETGYCAGRLHALGWYYTDPAVLTNKVTIFLAEDCTPTGAQHPDQGEDVRPLLFDVDAMPELIASGRVTHGLCIAAWHLYQSRVQRSRSRT
ncbi:MAG TPA: NUDIX hydrolase [Longimicrobiales bacterium]